MSVSPDIQQAVTDRLTLEAFAVWSEMLKGKVSASNIPAWLQHTIAVAEEQDNLGRAMAANIVLKAYVDEFQSNNFEMENWGQRIRTGVYQTVNA